MVKEEILNLTFKIILICIYSIFTITRVVSSRFVRKNYNNVKSKENKFTLLFLQIYIFITVVLFFLFIFFPQWFYWSQLPNYPRALQWIGSVLGVLANGLFIYAHFYLGKYFSYTLKIFNRHELIDSGPYKHVRHPMYTAFLILHIAVFLITANWFYGIIWIVGLLIVLILRIKQEERLLIETFGEDYIKYKERTGMFFPNLIKIIKNNRERIE